MFKLRDYQENIVDGVDYHISSGEKRFIIESKQGSGKGPIAIGIALRYPDRQIYISVHISALIDQFIKLADIAGLTDELSVVKSGYESQYDPSRRVQLIMDQTMINKLPEFKKVKNSIIITDEGQARATSDRYQMIIKHLEPAHEIWMSGTPFNSFGKQLIPDSETIKGPTWDYLIEHNHVAKLDTIVPKFALDLNASGIARSGADYNQDDLSSVYATDKWFSNIAMYIKENGYDKLKSIWFCTTVDSCDRLHSKLVENGITDIFPYHGNRKLNKVLMESFKTNEPMKINRDINLFNYMDDIETPPTVKGLISIAKLNTGFDQPDVEMSVMTAPTLVRSKYAQAATRASRFHESKDRSICLDFGANIVMHGHVQEEFEPAPYEYSTGEARVHNLEASMQHLGALDTNYGDAYLVDREWYSSGIDKILNDSRRFSEMTADELSSRFAIETKVDMVIAIGLAFMLVVHCEPMRNKWGKDDMGYMAESFDKDTNKTKYKPVVGFYNAKTLGWISEDIIKLFNAHSKDKVLISKWIKSLKTKIRSIINGKKSIYAIKFFGEFLLTNEMDKLGPEWHYYIHHASKSGVIYKYALPESAYDGELDEVNTEKYKEILTINTHDMSLTCIDNLQDELSRVDDDNPWADDDHTVDIIMTADINDIDPEDIPF